MRLSFFNAAALLACLLPGQALTTPWTAWAREDLVPGSRYTSARSAAMGDAFLPLADDGPSSLFYNPAGIGRIKGTRVEPLNVALHVNSGYASSLSTDFFKFPSLSGYLERLQANTGTPIGAGAAVAPSFATRGFVFGVLLQSHLRAEAAADGTITYRSRYQLIPSAGVGVRLAGGIVRMGYSLQWVNQTVGRVQTAQTDPSLGWNQALSQGSGFSHNVGFAMTLPLTYLPALNAVVRNFLNTRYSTFSLLPMGQNTTGAPAYDPMTIDASASIQPKLGAGAYVNIVLSMRDLTNESNLSYFKRGAFGLEFSFRDVIFLRGGWGSGYPNAGLGLRRKKGEFSLAWTSEEVGTSSQPEQDTRFLLQYQVRAF
jgi:hypothetical protein